MPTRPLATARPYRRQQRDEGRRGSPPPIALSGRAEVLGSAAELGCDRGSRGRELRGLGCRQAVLLAGLLGDLLAEVGERLARLWDGALRERLAGVPDGRAEVVGEALVEGHAVDGSDEREQ